MRLSEPTSLSVGLWEGAQGTVSWNLMLCERIWYQAPKVSFPEGLSLGNPEFREKKVRETKLSITGEHVGVP